jgi:hypothetical protein
MFRLSALLRLLIFICLLRFPPARCFAGCAEPFCAAYGLEVHNVECLRLAAVSQARLSFFSIHVLRPDAVCVRTCVAPFACRVIVRASPSGSVSAIKQAALICRM